MPFKSIRYPPATVQVVPKPIAAMFAGGTAVMHKIPPAVLTSTCALIFLIADELRRRVPLGK